MEQRAWRMVLLALCPVPFAPCPIGVRFVQKHGAKSMAHGAPCSMLHAPRSTLHAPRSMLRALCPMLHRRAFCAKAWSKEHGAWSMVLLALCSVLLALRSMLLALCPVPFAPCSIVPLLCTLWLSVIRAIGIRAKITWLGKLIHEPHLQMFLP